MTVTALAPLLSEEDFQAQVIELADVYRWLVYHTHDSRHSALGFPDLVLVRGVELLFVELKSATGRVRRDQTVWLAALKRIGDAVAFAVGVAVDADAGLPRLPDVVRVQPVTVEAYLWRPVDFPAIEARLKPRPTTTRRSSP